MQFYVYLNGAKRGPLSEERVQTLLAEGLLQPSDLAAEQPEGALKPLGDFRRFISSTAEETPEEVHARDMEMAPPPSIAPPPLPSARGTHLQPLSSDSLAAASRSALAPNETPLFRTSLHWIIFARFAGIALVVFLFVAMPFAIGLQALIGSELGWFALPLPALIMLAPTLAFASSELVVTDRRVLIKTGLIRRQSLEMFISKIESVGVDQGFFGRMFDYGTVLIRGTGGSEQPFEAIAHPLDFRASVQRLQTAEAHRR